MVYFIPVHASALFVMAIFSALLSSRVNLGTAAAAMRTTRVTTAAFQPLGRSSISPWTTTAARPSRLSSLSSFHYTVLDPLDNDEDGQQKQQQRSRRSMEKVLQVAEEAARQAGEIMKRTSGKIAVSSTKANNLADLVTESDYECQRIIQRVISEAFPNDLFFGEETTGEDVEKSGDGSGKVSADAFTNIVGDLQKKKRDDALLWIVDPIDGTTNFQAGLPMYCASIGVVSFSDQIHNNQPEVVAGVIYSPALDEIVSAVRGRGCYINGKRLLIGKDSKTTYDDDDKTQSRIFLDSALVNVGFPVSTAATLDVSSRAVAALATKVRGLRMIASASQVMSWVAQRKFHAYVSWNLNAWDVAAGMVIVEESGGRVCNFDGKRADVTDRDLIITCNEGDAVADDDGGLNGDLRSVLHENNCLHYQS